MPRFEVFVAEGSALTERAPILDVPRVAGRLGNDGIAARVTAWEVGAIASLGGVVAAAAQAAGSEDAVPHALVIGGGLGVARRGADACWRQAAQGRRKGALVVLLSDAVSAWMRARAADGATTHWEDAVLLGEALPALSEAHAFRRSGRVASSADMAAAADVTFAVLGGLVPEPLAARTVRSPVLERIRPGGTPQLRSLSWMPGRACCSPRTALVSMVAHIEEPLPVWALARGTGVRIRRLERLFHRHLDSSPTRFSREIRAHRVRALIGGSDPDLTEIAPARGFGSTGQPAEAFRRRLGRPPSCFRRPLFADPGGLDAQTVPVLA